jgi:hypothetical protein
VPNTREDADQLPELPPLGDSDETLPEGDLSELLRSFDAADEGLDDSTAEELDAGVTIEEEGPAPVEEGELTLDVGEVVHMRDDDESGATDELGPAGEPTGSAFDDGGALELDGDDAEGTLEPEDLIPEDLPNLSVAEGDDQEGALSEEADVLLGMSEEEPPRRAELPWLELPPVDSADRSVVRCEKGVVLAGGTGVLSVRGEGEVETLVASLGDTVTGLFLDPDAGVTLASTEPGRLFRLPAGALPEELTSFRAVHALDPARRLTLVLGGPTRSSRPAVLLHVSAGGGVLLESTDRGATFRQVDLGGRVVSLSCGVPPVCAVETEQGTLLLRSEASGAFRSVGGDIAIEDGARLVSDGDILAVLELGAGVRVSADGGVTFRRVAGSSRATAIAAGRLGGRLSAFAALFDAASGHTSLIWIDAATADAHVVSELSPDLDREDDELDEWSRVSSLAWDANDETLWAAGPFGLRRWRRPPSA